MLYILKTLSIKPQIYETLLIMTNSTSGSVVHSKRNK